MADATTIRYIYPPNMQDLPSWPGDGEERGRAGHQIGGFRRYILHLTNISDGSGESEASKFLLSEHYGPLGKIARRTVIEWIEYDVFGLDVSLYWQREPGNVLIARIPGGAVTTSGKIRGPLIDPGAGDGTDGTGNIVLTTANAASGDSYDIRMSIRVKEHPKPGINPEDAQANLLHEGDEYSGVRK